MRFTLALIAVAIFGISCKRGGDPDRMTEAKIHIAGFQSALDSFDVDCGRYPTTVEGLPALVASPPSVPNRVWHGPYLDKVARDPWGHDYIYLCPGVHNTNQFDVYSRGPDGVSRSGGDDADDINNWSRKIKYN
jgi:general secretion pathway protein G